MVFTILKYKKTIVNNITVTDKMLVEFIYNQEGKNYAARRKKQKKKWKTPHTFVILVAIIIIAAIATYLIPAGEFTRFKDAATGKTLVRGGQLSQNCI